MECLAKIWKQIENTIYLILESYPLDPFSEIFAVEQILILAFYFHVTDKIFLNIEILITSYQRNYPVFHNHKRIRIFTQPDNQMCAHISLREAISKLSLKLTYFEMIVLSYQMIFVRISAKIR